jgi:hypothetical protein
LEMEYVYVRKSKFNKLVRNDSNGKISWTNGNEST